MRKDRDAATCNTTVEHCPSLAATVNGSVAQGLMSGRHNRRSGRLAAAIDDQEAALTPSTARTTRWTGSRGLRTCAHTELMSINIVYL